MMASGQVESIDAILEKHIPEDELKGSQATAVRE